MSVFAKAPAPGRARFTAAVMAIVATLCTLGGVAGLFANTSDRADIARSAAPVLAQSQPVARPTASADQPG